MASDTNIFDRYLSILGIERERPSLQHLRQLVRAQIIGVPFENISKLYLKKTQNASSVPSLEEHLDGIERHNLGGTCYANNPFFADLLRSLGFDVTICGADMTKPDVHVVSLVHLDDREYLVDVGYGAPFFEPMPRDLDEKLEIAFGRNRFVLHPRDGDGRSRMDHLRDDEPIHGYVINPTPRDLSHFESVIRESYSDAATFMNVVVIERYFPDRSVRIHNLALTESTHDDATATAIAGRDELAEVIVENCGFPLEIVREAIDGLALESDIYS